MTFVDTDGGSALPESLERANFIFASRNPIRFQISEGELLLIITAGLQRPGEEPIPPQVLTIPFAFRVEQDGIVIERGTVLVEPLEEPESAAEQIARAGIMRRKIEESLPAERRRDRRFMVQREGQPEMPVWVTRVKALNGWVTVWAQ